ncbi:MAG: hypothetical protein HGB37_00515 [Candidatus Moranbacteria bacterium]|nr:hypothetical protein [Candidatus Moranbacteria bacterium]
MTHTNFTDGSLQRLRRISWEEVMSIWKDGEAWQDSWKQHWEERGFGSWEDWRMHYLQPYHPETLEWSLYRITDPLATVPDFFGAPSRNWIEKAYGGEMTKRLRDVVQLPFVTENAKINAVRGHFPNKVMLVAFLHEKRIILIEGMHRSCAMATWDPAVPFQSEVTIAIARWEGSELLISNRNQ